MVSANIKYLSTLPALWKLVTIIFSIIAITLGGHAYENSLYNSVWQMNNILGLNIGEISNLSGETFFLGVIGMLLIISVITLLCQILNEELSYTKTIKLVDIVIHTVGAFLQIIAGILMIISANKIDDDQPVCKGIQADPSMNPNQVECQLYTQKIFAGIFAIINFIPYLFVAIVGGLRFNSGNEPGAVFS